jgi:hypothetical protein
MRRFAPLLALFGLLCATTNRAESQALEAVPELTYADLADLALNAPVVALAEIDRASRLDEERAIGVAPGHVRYYVEAELQSLIRSPAPVPARVSYLVDMPLDADGRRPRFRDRRVILLAAPVPGRSGEIQLVAPDAQLDWTAAREERIRAILNEAAAADAPGIVTGVGSVFSVPGTLPGESETQIFLATSDGRPVSVSVLRRPNQRPRWSVSLSEIVESSVPPPLPNTLLWYRLACFLPGRLPESSMEAMDREQIATARADFRMVVDDLGRCPRNRR